MFKKSIVNSENFWFTKGVLFFQIGCAIIRIAKIRRGLGAKTSGPFSWLDGALSFHPSVHRREWKRMDTEKMRAALTYLKKKKPELTVQQYRTIKGQILAGDEDGAIRGIDRVVERNRRGRGYHAT